jgi:hypothetical protein
LAKTGGCVRQNRVVLTSSRFFDLSKTAEAPENKGISRVLLDERKDLPEPPGPDRPLFHTLCAGALWRRAKTGCQSLECSKISEQSRRVKHGSLASFPYALQYSHARRIIWRDL